MTAALLIARAELERGAGELGTDNGGPDVAAYHGREYVPRKAYGHWCAAFVSWCLFQVGDINTIVRGAKRLCRDVAALGQWVYQPRRLRGPLVRGQPAPGDVVCWHRGVPGSWMGHTGLVESYDPSDDTLITIEGNAARFPCRVLRKTYRRGAWRQRLYGVSRT